MRTVAVPGGEVAKTGESPGVRRAGHAHVDAHVEGGKYKGLVFDATGIASREPVLVLFADVEVLFEVFGRRAELDAGRIV